jgi:phytoene dehydrogenase-like protein
MARETVAIIGGGLAGLAAGAYAQMNGFECRVFEHGQRPGGVCTAWRREGYTFDGCIHWLVGAKPSSGYYRLYEELGVVRDVRLLPIEVLQRLLDESSGATLTLGRDLDRLDAELRALAPADAPLIDRLMSAARLVARADALAPPMAGTRLSEKISQMLALGGLLPVLFRFRGSYRRWVERLQTPQLQRLLTPLFDPEMPAFLLPTLLGWTAAGMACVEGGSDRFAEAVAKRFLELGGEIRYGATVDKVLVENDQAVGIRLQSGEVFRADRVISAADGRSTIFDMLAGRYVNRRIRERYRSWRLFNPILLIHFGAALAIPKGFGSTFIVLDPPMLAEGRSYPALFARVLDYDAGLAPPGHSVVQVLLEADYDHWAHLAGDAEAYGKAKAAVVDAVLDRLEPHLPGLRAAVAVTDVATPHTFYQFTRNHRGAYEGWLPTARALFTRVEQQLPGLGHFYMAGQWVAPGGGVPTALHSGRKVVELLCREVGRSFHAEKPQAGGPRPVPVTERAPSPSAQMHP